MDSLRLIRPRSLKEALCLGRDAWLRRYPSCVGNTRILGLILAKCEASREAHTKKESSGEMVATV